MAIDTFHTQPLNNRPKRTTNAVDEWLKENQPTVLKSFEKPLPKGTKQESKVLALKAQWLIKRIKKDGLSKKAFFDYFDKVQRQALKEYLKEHHNLHLFVSRKILKNGKSSYQMEVK